MLVIGADIGGTHSRFGLFQGTGGQLRLLRAETLASGSFASLEDALAKALQRLQASPEAAGFGVPGPVRNGVAHITNLPWIVNVDALSSTLGGRPAALLNDLEAQAWGVRWLSPADILVLQEGSRAAQGNRAIAAAGTGLGEAGLYWDGESHHPFATEGGHADFAPDSPGERLVSGQGLVEIFEFLSRRDAVAPEQEIRNAPDPAAAIAESALAGRCALCSRALDLFVELYGAEAGNLALKLMATGGVYLGGGIAPKILPRLQQQGFLRRFGAKGRFESLMRSIPVSVILNPHTALFGAAAAAIRRTGVQS
jgi:glucokinase